jgi:hypothetical protein
VSRGLRRVDEDQAAHHHDEQNTKSIKSRIENEKKIISMPLLSKGDAAWLGF